MVDVEVDGSHARFIRGRRTSGKKQAAALVRNIVEGEGPVPAEAIELQLIELFSCRPTDLDGEDGWKCLRLLELRRWRDTAQAFKQDAKSVSAEDRTRILLLRQGKDDALTRDIRKKKDTEKVADAIKEFEQQAQTSKKKRKKK